MEEIKILNKPDSITYEDIHNLIFLAHQSNRKNGFRVKTAEMNGKELKAHIGDDGKCFVAMDGERLVGVTAVRVVERNNRYARGKIADQILVAVHPDYVGMHTSTKLHEALIQYCKENGLMQIELRTADKNLRMQAACLKWGFKYVDFKAYFGLDHYTVVMMKWLETPPNDIRIKTYYYLKKTYIKLKFKPGRIQRTLFS